VVGVTPYALRLPSYLVALAGSVGLSKWAFAPECVGQLRGVPYAGRVPRRQPWWQTTRTVRQGYWMAGGYLLVGAGELFFGFTSGRWAGRWGGLAVGAGFVLMGAVYLTTAVALRRRQRGTPRL